MKAIDENGILESGIDEQLDAILELEAHVESLTRDRDYYRERADIFKWWFDDSQKRMDIWARLKQQRELERDDYHDMYMGKCYEVYALQDGLDEVVQQYESQFTDARDRAYAVEEELGKLWDVMGIMPRETVKPGDEGFASHADSQFGRYIVLDGGVVVRAWS